MSVFFINPFLGAVGGDYESIATVTVGSGGAANVEFTSISGSYQHLQIRGVVRGTAADTDVAIRVQLNGDTGSNYAAHQLSGDGSGTSAAATSSASLMNLGNVAAANASASIFGACVIDLLDYASSSKAKTLRSFSGNDRNGSGIVTIRSGLWTSTNAVTSVKIYPSSGNWAQHSTLALYGVKAP